MPVTETAAVRLGGLYFGWRVVFALSICVAALAGVAISSFIMFSAPLAAEFGWNPAETGSLVSAMWAVGPLTLIVGPFVSRAGAWRLLMCGMAIQVLVLACVQFSSAFWHLYALRMVMGVGKIFIMTSAPIIVARWFKRRFATAMAVVWAAGAGGQIIMSPLTEWLVNAAGWRMTALMLSGGFIVVAIAAGLCARGPASPESGGGSKDYLKAEFAPEPGVDETEPLTERWIDTVRSLNWFTVTLMAIAVIGGGMSSIAFQSQSQAIFESMAITSGNAALLLSLFAFLALIGSLLTGYLLDRMQGPANSLIVTAAIAVGLLALHLASGSGDFMLAAVASAALGYGFGAGEVLWITLFKRQFGSRAFATTYGFFYLSFQIGMGAGGGVGGWSFQTLGISGFAAVAALLYIPAAVFSLWRPRGLVAR